MAKRDLWQRDRGEYQGSQASPYPVQWFICTACGRGLKTRYRPDRPLPACVGGRWYGGRHEPMHPPRMLEPHAVKEAPLPGDGAAYDVWRIMFDRFMRGETMLKPIIHNQNYMHFPLLIPVASLAEFAAHMQTVSR